MMRIITIKVLTVDHEMHTKKKKWTYGKGENSILDTYVFFFFL